MRAPSKSIQHSSTPSPGIAEAPATVSSTLFIKNLSCGQLFPRRRTLLKGTPLSLHLGSFGSPFFLQCVRGCPTLVVCFAAGWDFESPLAMAEPGAHFAFFCKKDLRCRFP